MGLWMEGGVVGGVDETLDSGWRGGVDGTLDSGWRGSGGWSGWDSGLWMEGEWWVEWMGL